MKTYRLLIAAGNYDLTYQARQVLTGQFALQAAYSHRDTLHALRAGCDAVLIDAAMYDRMSGDHTAEAIRRLHPTLPLIVYVGDMTNGWERRLNDALALTSLEERALRSAVLRALKVPNVVDVPPAVPDTRPILTEPLWRSDEIKTLFALGRSLTEVLELSEVLNRVVEAARRLTHAEEGMILLPDAETGDLYLRARVGIDSDVARNFRVKPRDSLAGHVFSTGEPLLVGDRGPQKVKTQYFVNALLYVPILLKGRPIGVLGVNNRVNPSVFTPRDQELLVNLASYAAIAIENARIHGQSVKRARELKVLVDATQTINQSLVMERLLPTICQQIMRVLNIPYVEICDWQAAERRIRSLAFRTAGRWRSGHELIRSLDGLTMLQAAFTADQVVVLRRDDPGLGEHERRWLQQTGAEVARLLPVMVAGRPLGAVIAYYTQPSALLPQEDLSEAQALALDLVARAVNGLPAAALRQTEDLCRLLHAHWCEVVLYQAEPAAMRTALCVGEGVFTSVSPAGTAWSLLAEQVAPLMTAVETLEPLPLLDDAAVISAGERALLEHTRMRSLTALPLVLRGQLNAVVLLGDVDANRVFTPRELDLARAVIAQAATALDNARLLHDLERSLSELKETQTRLIQAARLSAMGELAAAVAHQINNPLTTIVLDTELLHDNPALDPETRYVLEAIIRAGKKAGGVVRRLLATVRPSSTDPAKMEPIDVRYTIEETLALVRSHLQREHIHLFVNLPAVPLPPVYAIPGELDDVWLNLLLNAHDALSGQPNPTLGVDVTYPAAGTEIQVAIWDNGYGIDDKILQDIFKPFFTTKPVGEGTGLGLHICRQVVDRIGGQITVESTPGHGTRFIVHLPVIKPTLEL